MRKNILLMTVSALLIVGCVGDFKTVEKGDVGASRKVLFAGTASEFKLKVVDAVIGRLGITEYHFKITGLDNLKSEDLSSYGAVVLVCPMMAGSLNRRVTDWVKDHPADPKLIVFYTRGTDDPPPEKAKPKLGVDAISAASVDSRVDERAEELAALIRKRFQ